MRSVDWWQVAKVKAGREMAHGHSSSKCACLRCARACRARS